MGTFSVSIHDQSVAAKHLNILTQTLSVKEPGIFVRPAAVYMRQVFSSSLAILTIFSFSVLRANMLYVQTVRRYIVCFFMALTFAASDTYVLACGGVTRTKLTLRKNDGRPSSVRRLR